jgi:hypothetical protein
MVFPRSICVACTRSGVGKPSHTRLADESSEVPAYPLARSG